MSSLRASSRMWNHLGLLGWLVYDKDLGLLRFVFKKGKKVAADWFRKSNQLSSCNLGSVLGLRDRPKIFQGHWNFGLFFLSDQWNDSSDIEPWANDWLFTQTRISFSSHCAAFSEWQTKEVCISKLLCQRAVDFATTVFQSTRLVAIFWDK